jgi:hypothetical protein
MRHGRINRRPTIKILFILHDEFDFLVSLIKGFVKALQLFVVGELNWPFVFDENDENVVEWDVK